MVIDDVDITGRPLEPPVNTHVSHAFYLNCRKLADFFQNKAERGGDDVIAMHFVTGYAAKLSVSDGWRREINKQLAHVTYSRDVTAREIDRAACEALFRELQETWRDFRRRLPQEYAEEFVKRIHERKSPYPSGMLSEFRGYDLD